MVEREAHFFVFWELRGMPCSQYLLFSELHRKKEVAVHVIHFTRSAQGFPGKPSRNGAMKWTSCDYLLCYARVPPSFSVVQNESYMHLS